MKRIYSGFLLWEIISGLALYQNSAVMILDILRKILNTSSKPQKGFFQMQEITTKWNSGRDYAQ